MGAVRFTPVESCLGSSLALLQQFWPLPKPTVEIITANYELRGKFCSNHGSYMGTIGKPGIVYQSMFTS